MSSPVRWLALALLLAAAAYARTIDGEFQFDDRHAIEENPEIKALGNFTPATFFAAWLHGGRPVTQLTFALNYSAGRLSPRGYHLVNLALHLGLVVLLWRLGVRLLRRAGARDQGAALAAAALFAVHPLGSQAVSYVVQRGEVLASVFYVGALLLLLRADESPRPWLPALGGTVCAVLGLGAKAIVLTLPAAFLLATWAFPVQRPRRVLRLLALITPAAAAAALFAVGMLRGVSGRGDVGFDVPNLSAVSYLLTEARVLLRYLGLVVLPVGQNLDHDVPLFSSVDLATVAAVAAVLGILALSAWLWSRLRVAAFGLLWFFLLLAPTSTVIPVVDVMIEHRVYLAQWGVLLAITAVADWLLRGLPATRRRRLAVGLVGGVCAALALALWARNAVWERELALWRDVAAKSPLKSRAHMNFGNALDRHGEVDAAAAEYATALTLFDSSASHVEVLRNLGALELRRGRRDQAEAALARGLTLAPHDAELLNNLAILALERGDTARAEDLARRAAEANPKEGRAWNSLGEARLARGELESGLAAFVRSAELNPDVALRHWNVAVALEGLGRNEEACAAIARFVAAERNIAEHAAANTWSRRLGCAVP